MSDRRKKDIEWDVADKNGNIETWERVGVAVLMDIRDELKRLNFLLHCRNFQGIPSVLKEISSNTAKKRRKKETKKGIRQ